MANQEISASNPRKRALKSLDFVVRRPKKKAPKGPVSAAEAPKKSSDEPTAVSKAPRGGSKADALSNEPVRAPKTVPEKKAPSEPTSTPKPPVRRPVQSRGKYLDFVSHAPRKPRPVTHTSTSVTVETIAVESHSEPTSVTPKRDDFFAETTTPVGLSTPVAPDVVDEPPSPLDEELSALEELSVGDIFDGLGDDIDAIEAEIEAAAESKSSRFGLGMKNNAKKSAENAKSGDANGATGANSTASTPGAPAADSPYRFTPGGASPFLSSVSVEKRPLSATSDEAVITTITTPVAPKPAKPSILPKLSKSTAKSAPASNPVMPARRTEVGKDASEKESRGAGFAIAIILTILLGLGIGALIYLVFF